MVIGQLKNTEARCPSCDKKVDGYKSVDHEEQPKPGDVTICVYCRSVLSFTEDMGLAMASAEDMQACGLLEISRGQQQAKMLQKLEQCLEKKNVSIEN